MKHIRPLVLVGIAVLVSIAPLRASNDSPLFRNADLPVEQRVDDLVSRLTVAEKIRQLMMASPAIPRLNIPEYDWWNEGLHGIARNGPATVFPQAIGLAATWNPELHHRIAEAISTEARAKNNDLVKRTGGASGRYQGLTIWSPNINIFRDPRWGRGQETYGEDPFLTSRFGVAFVRGIQGDDPRYLKAVATVKHFAVHSGPESLRHSFNAVVSERDLHETYLPAFEACIREGGAQSLMSAYNAVDGVPAPANKRLLTDILRKDWGFTGAVVGDVDTVGDMTGGHHFTRNAAEASATALKAGNDECSGGTYDALPEALKRGLVAEADLDVALRRLFALRFRLGQFDPPDRVPYAKIPITENDSPAHDRLALEAARQSLVLLKNDGTLPWDALSLKTVAVLGPTGDLESTLLGNYNGPPARRVTLIAGLREKLQPLGVRVLYEPAVPLAKGFHDTSLPFPAGALFTDAARARPGLAGEVFSNPTLQGAPVSTRVDEQIDLRWSADEPVSGVPVRDASVRWTGVVVPPAAGDYRFSVAAAGSVRLFVDDKAVIDDWNPKGVRTVTASATFAAGDPHTVRLEYAQTKGGGRIQFGWNIPGGASAAMDHAIATARAADHIVLTLGLTPDLEGEEMSVKAEGFAGGDRTSILLPASQRELLDRVSALGKPVVVVLTTGSAVSLDPAKAGAVLVCWYFGQRGSEAVAEALLGETNPGGRLPITFYQSEADLPPFADYSMANRTYRYFKGKPLFAFGHGLSYTTFSYEKIALSTEEAKPRDTINVSVTIKNTGARAGDEVVEVYARAVNPPAPMPIQQLVGFQRVPLAPGESKVVAIPIRAESLRRWDDAKGQYVVDPGSYELRAGPSSDRPLLTATLKFN